LVLHACRGVLVRCVRAVRRRSDGFALPPAPPAGCGARARGAGCRCSPGRRAARGYLVGRRWPAEGERPRLRASCCAQSGPARPSCPQVARVSCRAPALKPTPPAAVWFAHRPCPPARQLREEARSLAHCQPSPGDTLFKPMSSTHPGAPDPSRVATGTVQHGAASRPPMTQTNQPTKQSGFPTPPHYTPTHYRLHPGLTAGEPTSTIDPSSATLLVACRCRVC